MTNHVKRAKNTKVSRADNNLARKIQAVRGLEKLLRDSTKEGFDGEVVVRIATKGGQLGRPGFTITEWAEPLD